MKRNNTENADANMAQISVAARMSKRLIAIAEMLRGVDAGESGTGDFDKGDTCAEKGLVVADVGCDHGYVSIYLLQSGIAKGAIAMDVRKGPLSGAYDNIREYGLDGLIETRLSDGLKELSAGEANALIVAGMGGKLMMRILEERDPKRLLISQGILQPQSDIDEFRAYLRDKGYIIVDEKVLLDDGKFYFPMRVVFGDERLAADRHGRIHDYLHEAMTLLVDKTSCNETMARHICDRFGEINILNRDEVLKNYLEHGKKVSESILKTLEDKGHLERAEELKKDLLEIESALLLYR
ncbi:class I SAM-dependent methyltransferase [Butyrivibrio sp. XBB1001]|uniref:class I SAM-dependent methyltransferase n=1 Tax=Butyrivibrio sp. XBB1001 TaxID=1280682 RepID=UPI000410F014|nr:class I SAM-dependent methyltransferase [Butyrivibrio sp. XBB1001]